MRSMSLPKDELTKIFVCGHENRFAFLCDLQDPLIRQAWDHLRNSPHAVFVVTELRNDGAVDSFVNDEIHEASGVRYTTSALRASAAKARAA